MLTRTVLALASVGCLGFAIGTGAAEKQDKAGEAKEVCFKFARAMVARDAEGAVKLAGIPFLDTGGGELNIVRDRAALKAALTSKEKVPPAPDVVKKFDFEAGENLTYAECLEKHGKKMPPEFRKALAEIMKKDS